MSAASSCRSSSAWGIDLASAELVFAGPDIDLYQPRREPGSSRVDQISYRRCRPETPPGFADSDRGGCAGAILIQALTSYTLIRLLSTSAQRLMAPDSSQGIHIDSPDFPSARRDQR